MKTDLSAFDALRRRKGPPCSVGVAIARLDKDESAAVAAAIAAGKTSRAVAIVLTQWSGVSVREQSVARHRRGDCLCG